MNELTLLELAKQGIDLSEVNDRYIKNSSYFDYSNIPPEINLKNIKHRDIQIAELSRLFKKVYLGEKPNHITIYGKSGTGKTMVVEKFIGDLEEYMRKSKLKDKLIVFNVNCRKFDNNYDIAYHLAKKLLGLGQGYKFHQLVQFVFDKLEKEGKSLLLILDEIEKPIQREAEKEKRDDFLYEISNQSDQWIKEGRKHWISIIAITNSQTVHEKIKSSTMSRLGTLNLPFTTYNASALNDILTQRIEYIYYPNVEHSSSVARISAFVARETGDSRHAFRLLSLTNDIAIETLQIDHFIHKKELPEKLPLKESYVDEARERLEIADIAGKISKYPLQLRLLFVCLLLLNTLSSELLQYKFVSIFYLVICLTSNITPVSRRQIFYNLGGFADDGLVEVDGYGRNPNKYPLTISPMAQGDVLHRTIDHPFSAIIENKKELLTKFISYPIVYNLLRDNKISNDIYSEYYQKGASKEIEEELNKLMEKYFSKTKTSKSKK